jgi:hypothetical protein
MLFTADSNGFGPEGAAGIAPDVRRGDSDGKAALLTVVLGEPSIVRMLAYGSFTRCCALGASRN